MLTKLFKGNLFTIFRINKNTPINFMAKKLTYADLELKIELLNKNLASKESELESLKSIFLSNVSHEIRTPMNAIVGFSNLLGDTSYNDNQKLFFIEEIKNNSQILLRLIDNLLLSSRIQSQKFSLELTTCNLKEIVHQLYLSHSNRLKKENRKNIELKLIEDENPESEIQIYTDPKKLNLALSNLIDNAIKFTKNGVVEFGFRHLENEIQFFVNDTGKGIASKNLKPFFRNVFQGRQGIEAEESGLGISLSLSSKIIEFLGGKLLIQSIPGEGSTFSFCLPLHVEKTASI